MNQPKRVLHLPYTLGRESGIMSVLMNMYRNIDHTQVQFDFLYFKESNESYKDEIIALGGRVHYISQPTPLTIIKFIKEIRLFFKNNSNQYIGVHYHAISIASICLIYAKKYGIKNRIVHSHNTKYADKKYKILRNYILCLPIKKYANQYVACSKKASDFLYGKDIKTAVKIINNAIDCEKFIYEEVKSIQIKKQLGIEDQFVVGHVGRFSEQKNHKFLLQVFAEIKKKKENVKLILVGKGPLEEEVKIKATELGIIQDILFLGIRSDIESILLAMDVFVLPSLFEGLGIVLIEAQASGLPSFTSDVVPQEAQVTQLLQYMSLTCSPEDWADKIIKSSGKVLRTAQIESIRMAGFDIKEEARNLQNYYLEMGI